MQMLPYKKRNKLGRVENTTDFNSYLVLKQSPEWLLLKQDKPLTTLSENHRNPEVIK